MSKIVGVTVGTTLPKPNFKQTDPTKGDYIKNKPDFEGLKSKVDTISDLVGDTKVSEQIHNSIDGSLSISGMAADAKIVGDQFTNMTTKFDDYYLKSEANTLHTEIKDYVDTEVAALVNSAPETLDTLGELAAAFKENQDVVDALDAAITTKANIPSVITNITNPLILNDNAEYYLTNVSSLTLQYPSDNFEVWMNIKFISTGTINVAFPTSTIFIGAEPTFGNSETWELSIKNGVAICWRAE